VKNRISRRDFLGGVALTAAGLNLSPLEAVARGLIPASALGEDYYPPGLTGLRGSHPGSFSAAHAVAREGQRFSPPREQTGPVQDLVVVGGGISGLSAAKFYRDRYGKDARILVLDNHDDFGGHARRNELSVDGKTLIGYGGSQTIDSPSSYSRVASGLLRDLGIHLDRFYDYFDQSFFSRRNMGQGIYFDAGTYGRHQLVPHLLQTADPSPEDVAAAVDPMPLAETDRAAFARLLAGHVDYLQGRSVDDKRSLLRHISYLDFLAQYAGMPPAVGDVLRDSWLPMIGVGWEAASALEAAEYGFPGTRALAVNEDAGDWHDDPYIHHFPDGNASIARLLVRDLVPDAIPGSTMEDLVTARANYGALDRDGQSTRVRLNSTAVNVQHTPDDSAVDVTYMHAGDLYRVRSRHVIMACYNTILPHICPELPQAQIEAIQYATKIPFVIGSFAIRNWRAFEQAGYYNLYTPGNALFKYLGLDFPVSMGSYQYSQSPDEPIVISAWHTPTARGLPNKAQYRAGRAQMLEMSFSDYETDIFSHLGGMLGPYGFDPERDIAAITLNRWPHGYAYEFEGIGVPAEYDRQNGPHIAGRQRLGRISIANSDSEAWAYADGAIDAANRAVNEQLQL